MQDKKESMEQTCFMNNRTLGKNVLLFLVLMSLALYTVLKGQNLAEIWRCLRGMSGYYLFLASGIAIFYVCAEGFMIWYLLQSFQSKCNIFRCFGYSFIGFFYSGVTPSATGGQPMQLYYMKKDGHSVANSSVVLMVVAAMYKFVLVVIGFLLLLFLGSTLKIQFGNYYGLFILGLMLNTILVVLILWVMLFPQFIIRLSRCFLNLSEKKGLIRNASLKLAKVERFVHKYQEAITYLQSNMSKLCIIFIVTVLQRSSMFFLTYFIYRGFGLSGESIWTISALQASVYVAVDMLPIPGAQGITEIVFKKVFLQVLGTTYVLPLMIVSRGINFYFLFLIALIISMRELFKKKEGVRQ